MVHGLKHIKATALLVPTLSLALSLAAPARLGAQTPDFAWRGTVARGAKIEVKGVNGPIRAEPARGGEVEVRAFKTARRSNPDEVTFDVITHAGGVTICAIYPSRSSHNVCGPGEQGRLSANNNDVKVEFVVYVPEGVNLVARTVNGNIEAHSIPGDISARTVNGSIRLSATGTATASTVNGSIVASLGRAEWQGTNVFKTTNGSITLEFPATLGAELDARTTNGSIDTDFPIQVQGRINRRQLTGVIGEAGGRRLEVRTVNGSIKLRRSAVS